MKSSKIIKILVLGAMLIVLGQFAFGQDFETANKQYTEGDYEGAIASYEKLLEGEQHAATLYYNLGNAYFKIGNLANAILNYERAYRLNPSDKDIRENLAFANTQIADKIEVKPRFFISKRFHRFTEQFHSNLWAYIALGFWALVFIGLLLFIFSRNEQQRKLLFAVSLLSLCIALFSFYAAYSQYQKQNTEKAIVFAQNITVNSTPSNNGTELFILHEGTKVQILDKVGNWYKIQLADEREGWLPETEVVKI